MQASGTKLTKVFWFFFFKKELLPIAHRVYSKTCRTDTDARTPMVVRIGGKRMFLWRAADDEGEVLDVLVQKRRDRAAAVKLLKRLLKNHGVHPETITTDGLASYGAAARELGLTGRHRSGGMRDNNRAENSHPMRRPTLRHLRDAANGVWVVATEAALFPPQTGIAPAGNS